jgi:hypothetical protein
METIVGGDFIKKSIFQAFQKYIVWYNYIKNLTPQLTFLILKINNILQDCHEQNKISKINVLNCQVN